MVGWTGRQLTAEHMPTSCETRSMLPWAPRQDGLGLYLHVPFCSAICHYCNFNRGLDDAALRARYVDALQAEIYAAADGSRVDSIYFGGGTPSLLEPAQIRSLLRACSDAFVLAPATEITLEANPESVTPSWLAAVREAGVNRLSMGVQSFDDAELRRLGRLHSAARARMAVAEARDAGFRNISLDLMMWLPEQDLSGWLANVDALIEASPEHASLYLLEIYPNAPLRDAMVRQKWHTAPDDVAADMYLEGMARLESAGYQQYEISNVAREGHFAWHNVKYWTDGEWNGFGAGAHGTRHGVRTRNVSATGDYIGRIEAGRSACAERRPLSSADALAEALMMGLRLCGGVDVPRLGTRYDCDIMAHFGESLAPFLQAGLVTFDGRRLALTREGLLLANEILSVFV